MHRQEQALSIHLENQVKELKDKLQHLRDCRWEQIKALSFDHIDHSRRLHKIIRHVRQRYGSLLSKFLETKTCLEAEKAANEELQELLVEERGVNAGLSLQIQDLKARIKELEEQLENTQYTMADGSRKIRLKPPLQQLRKMNSTEVG